MYASARASRAGTSRGRWRGAQTTCGDLAAPSRASVSAMSTCVSLPRRSITWRINASAVRTRAGRSPSGGPRPSRRRRRACRPTRTPRGPRRRAAPAAPPPRRPTTTPRRVPARRRRIRVRRRRGRERRHARPAARRGGRRSPTTTRPRPGPHCLCPRPQRFPLAVRPPAVVRLPAGASSSSRGSSAAELSCGSFGGNSCSRSFAASPGGRRRSPFFSWFVVQRLRGAASCLEARGRPGGETWPLGSTAEIAGRKHRSRTQ